MKTINVTMLGTTDRTLICTSGGFTMGYRGDNCSAKVVFSVPSEYVQKNALAVLIAPVSKKQYSIPLSDMSFYVTSAISAEVGKWQITLMLTGGKDDADMPVCISAPVYGEIKNSDVDTTKLETLPVDANMQVLYNDMLSVYNSLKETLLTAPAEDVKKIEDMLSTVQSNTAAIAKIDFSGLAKVADMGTDVKSTLEAAKVAQTAAEAAQTAAASLKDYTADKTTLDAVKSSVEAINTSVASLATASAVEAVRKAVVLLGTPAQADALAAVASAVAALPKKADIPAVPSDYAKETTSAEIRKDIAALPQKADIPAVPTDYAKVSDLSGLAKKTDIPSDYATASAVAALPQAVPSDYAKEKTLTDLTDMTTGYYQTLNNMLNAAVSSANSAKNSADDTGKEVSSLSAFIGTAAKEDGTISNWSYWGMIRADEAKAQAAANASSIAALPQKSDIPSVPTDYAKKTDIPSVSSLALETTAQSILSAIGAAQTAAAEV